MNAKEILLDQFNFCYNKKNWFVSLKESLTDLSSDCAFHKKDPSLHSVAELVNHLLFWNERYLFRFKELEVPELAGDNDTTFIKSTSLSSEAEWNAITSKLFAVMDEFRKVIGEAGEEKLNSSPLKDGSDNWKLLIANINAHNAYHTGQIVLLRKLQGSWKNEAGVK